MPDVGVLNLSIKSNSASAATNLNNLADALTHVKSVVGRTLGSKIEGVATAIEKIKAATQGGMGTGMAGIAQSITSASKNLSKSNAASNFRKAAEAIDEYVNAYHKLIGATSSDKVRAGSMMKLDLGQFGQKTKLEVSDLMGEQLKMDLDSIDSGFKNVERTIQGAVEDSNELMSTINGNSLDFSKFDISKLPISSLGMKMDEASRDITRFGTVVKDTFETIRDQGALDTVSKIEEVGNAVTAIIPYNENLNNSWENICNTISRANGKISEQADIVESVNAAQVAKEQALDADAVETVKVNIEVQKPSGDTLGEFAKEEIEASKNAVQLNENLKKVDKELKQKKKDATGAAFGFHDMSKAIKHLFPTLSKIEKQFGKIMLRRSVTAVIRAITRSFKEGVENVYKYSEAIGSGFAPALDSAKSMLSQFKNSIGAAVAPLIQALIPVFNQIVSAAINVINVLNQLFSLLSGKSTWTRALPQATQAFEDTKKAASGAGGAIKDMLASFDELNVLDQNSGGGGGGGAASAVEDYANMFEEVGEFDSKIKDVVSWLESHLPVVNGLVAGLAAALLGLPLSISIGIGLIVTGFSMAYEAGRSIGKDGFTTENLFELIKGYALSSIGGALVGAGVAKATGMAAASGAFVGLLVGFSIALVAMAIGIERGSRDRMYGDLHYEVDEIKKFVRDAYKFKISPVIELFNTKIEGLESLRTEVTKSIEDVNVAYIVAKNSNFNQKDVEDLARKVKELVERTQEYIRGMKEYSVLINAQLNPGMTVESLEGWDILEGIVTELGTQIGGILSDGVVDEFEKTTLEKLQGSLTRITAAMTNASEKEKYNSAAYDIREAFVTGQMDQSGFQTYLDEMKSLNQDTMDTAKKSIAKQAENLAMEISGLEQAKLEGYTVWNGKDVDKALENARAEYAIYEDLKKRNKLIKELYTMWTDESILLQRSDLLQAYKSVFGNDAELAKVNMRDVFGTYRTTDMSKNLNDILSKAIANMTGQSEKFVLEIQDMYNITGWDILSDELKTNLFKVLHQNVGMAWPDVIKTIKNTYSLSISEILKGLDWEHLSEGQKKYFAKTITEIFNPEDVREFLLSSSKEVVDYFADYLEYDLDKIDITKSASEMIQVSGWQTFEFEQKLQFIRSLMAAYGAPEALTAAKNAGINVAEMIQAGLDSKDPDVRRTAQGIADAIRSEIENRKINVGVDADLAVQIDALVNVVPQVEGGVIGAAKSTISKVTSNVKSIFERLGSSLKQIQGKANGAYGIPNGDLFIANEAGPELVGTIGGKTSVANQGQIIEGISTGVERANEEQNALLREQNNLLRRLLEKDATVRIGASAALGRTVKQSLDMYGGMAGG